MRRDAAHGRLRDLAWLAATELRHRVTGMAARLRSPRYLVAFLVGVGYFVILFAPQLFAASEPLEAPAWLGAVAPIAVALLVLYWWLRGGYQRALAFRPAEVDFLFPAPLTRRALIAYRLIRAQPGVLGSAVLIALLGGAPLRWYYALPAAWVLVATLHLHQVASSLVRVTALQRRGAGIGRAAAPLAVATVIAGALLWTVGRAIAAARSAASLEGAGEAALAALGSAVAQAALLPFVLLIDPLAATTPGAWATAMAGAAGLLALHVLWVLRTDAAFEEAAAEAGRRQAEIVAAARAGRPWWRLGKEEHAPVRRWIRLPLAPTGEPALALTWSNLMALTGDVRRTTVAVLLLGALAVFGMFFWAAGSLEGAAAGMVGIMAVAAGAVLVLGPMAVRYDLRRDLARLEVLRAYPIEPRWLVIGEIAAPVIVLTAVELLLLAASALLLPLSGASPRLTGLLVTGGLFLVVNTPGLLALQVAIQNAMALLFPDWVRIGPSGGGGIDAVGQGILSMLAAVLALGVLLLFPIIAGLAVTAAYHGSLAGWGAVPGAAAFTGAVWLQVAWLVRWLGHAYARLDPSQLGVLAR